MKKVFVGVALAATCAFSGAAFAQTRGVTARDDAAGDPRVAPSVAPDPQQPLRFGRNVEHSVGARFWVFNVPSWLVGAFASVNPEWSGPLTVAAGPEYVYRRGSLDIVLGLQYTGLQADAGYFHGNSETDVATERVESQLWGLYANALFLWHVRANDWFEFQYGAGVGLGYVGGDLYRTQVYPQGGGYAECTAQLVPDAAYCDRANLHYRSPDGTRYSEGRLTDTQSGSIPPVVPWISLPHIALHFRPHRNFDVRVDGGFALIGFYGGLAMHYVF